jgi:hypothetical protein
VSSSTSVHRSATCMVKRTTVFADSGYRGAPKRPDAGGVIWHIAVRPSDRRRLRVGTKPGSVLDKIETLRASVRAKVEHPFRVVKRAIQSHEGALPRPPQEHGPVEDLVRAAEPVDGALEVNGAR